MLKNGDGVERYESKNRGYVRDKFWGGDRTRFVPELRRAASTHIIERKAAIISPDARPVERDWHWLRRHGL